MDQTATLLGFIWHNAQSGIEMLSRLSILIRDEPLLRQLRTQRAEYRRIADMTASLGREYGLDRHRIDALTVAPYLSIDPSSIGGKSASHVAEALMLAGAGGIVCVSRCLNCCAGADESVVGLLEILLRLEEACFEALRVFL